MSAPGKTKEIDKAIELICRAAVISMLALKEKDLGIENACTAFRVVEQILDKVHGELETLKAKTDPGFQKAA